MLVLFVCVTFLFDFMHLFVYHDSREDDEADSGNAGSVRLFSYFFVWISFLFRPVVAAVLWKDCLDYMKIIRERNNDQSDVLTAIHKYGEPSHRTMA